MTSFRRAALIALALTFVASAASAQSTMQVCEPSETQAAALPAQIEWEQLPTPDDMFAAYPAAARGAHIVGVAALECTFQADRRIACLVAGEDPAGQGFGQAALSLSRKFRAAANPRDPRIRAGCPFRFPIRFRVDAEANEQN
ncbi:MAG: hypothetical protein ABW199_08790 [Caulobacterales bacterium]